MTTQDKITQGHKARAARNALATLGAELAEEGHPNGRDIVREAANLPADSAAKLYDLLQAAR